MQSVSGDINIHAMRLKTTVYAQKSPTELSLGLTPRIVFYATRQLNNNIHNNDTYRNNTRHPD